MTKDANIKPLLKKCLRFKGKKVRNLYNVLTDEERALVEGYSEGFSSWSLYNENDLKWCLDDIIKDAAIEPMYNNVRIWSKEF